MEHDEPFQYVVVQSHQYARCLRFVDHFLLAGAVESWRLPELAETLALEIELRQNRHREDHSERNVLRSVGGSTRNVFLSPKSKSVGFFWE